jgi:hypothetical protein
MTEPIAEPAAEPITKSAAKELFRETVNELSTGYCVLDPHLRRILTLLLCDLAQTNKRPVTNMQEAFIATKSIDRTLGYVSDECAKFIQSIDVLRKQRQ